MRVAMTAGILAVAVLGYSVIIGTSDAAPAEPGPPRLLCVRVTEAPRLDGVGADASWMQAPLLQLPAVRTLKPDGSEPVTVTLRAVHTDTHVYVLARWSDTSADLSHKTWTWTAERSAYEEGADREDMLSLAFEHTGSFTTDMLAGVDAVWDVWHWKALRTNPQGFAMDKTHRYALAQPAGKAKQYTSRDGKPLWISRPEDEGGSVERKKAAPAANEGERVPQFEPGIPTGSAADVQAKGAWADGHWTLELARRLDTGHADDTAFRPGRTYRGAAATFDRTGDMDRSTDAFEIVFLKSASIDDFEGTAAGQAPAGYRAGLTGGGSAGRWVVEAAPDAPSGKAVLAQRDADDTDFRFPHLVSDRVVARDVTAAVTFKTVSGRVDQAAGLVVRWQDANNYYIARANALEGNVRLYRVVGGRRQQIASASVAVTPGRWHGMALEVRERHLRVYYEGRLLLEADDTTITQAGRAGVWTKADSVTLFDDLRIVEPYPEGY